MSKHISLQCGKCESKECRKGKDCFSQAHHHRQLYQDNDIAKLLKAASMVEGKYYGKETRLGETILFAQELECQSIGLAFCIGLSEEAKRIDKILSKHFKVLSVCCKVCGINKEDFDLQHISPGDHEVMCNPAGQAELLNKAGTQLNILCGLCVGHDAIFAKISKSPVITLIAKDRVLAHNPAGAIYSKYIRRNFLK